MKSHSATARASVTTSPAALTTAPLAYWTFRFNSPPPTRLVGNGSNAFDIAIDHRVHDSFHGLVVEHGHAAYLVVLLVRAHVEFLQPLQPGHDEEVAAQHAVVDLALAAAAFFCCSNACASVTDGPARRNVSTWISPWRGLPVGAGISRALLRHELGRQADLRAGGPVVDICQPTRSGWSSPPARAAAARPD